MVGGISVCVMRDRSTMNVKVDTQDCGLGEDVPDLGFEL